MKRCRDFLYVFSQLVSLLSSVAEHSIARPLPPKGIGHVIGGRKIKLLLLLYIYGCPGYRGLKGDPAVPPQQVD